MLPLVFIFVSSFAFAQQASINALITLAPEGPENDPDRLAKLSDGVLWRMELADAAEVRTFRHTGLPNGCSTNPVILYAYSLIPNYSTAPKSRRRARLRAHAKWSAARGKEDPKSVSGAKRESVLDAYDKAGAITMARRSGSAWNPDGNSDMILARGVSCVLGSFYS